MGLGPYIRQGLMTYHRVLEILPRKNKEDYFASQDGAFAHFLEVWGRGGWGRRKNGVSVKYLKQ